MAELTYYQECSSKNLLSIEHFEEFLSILDTVFPEDYSKTEGKAYKKAKYTFNIFIKNGWKLEQFQHTMKDFVEKWHKAFWMPADFLEEFENIYHMKSVYL